MTGATSKKTDRWADLVWIDAAVGVGVGLAAWAALTWLLTLRDILPAGRAEMYASAGGIVGVLGALATVALSVYSGGTGRRLNSIRRQDRHGTLRRNLLVAFIVPPASAVACWVATGLEYADYSDVAGAIVVGAVTWSALTFGRQTWLLWNLMAIADLDAAEELPQAKTSRRTRPRAEREATSLPSGRDERAVIPL